MSSPTSRNSLVVSFPEVRIVLFLKEIETSFSEVVHSEVSLLHDAKKNVLKINIANECLIKLQLTSGAFCFRVRIHFFQSDLYSLRWKFYSANVFFKYYLRLIAFCFVMKSNYSARKCFGLYKFQDDFFIYFFK